MTEQEIQRRLLDAKAFAAFGGYHMSYQSECDLRKVWNGECTYEELIEQLKEECKGKIDECP